MKPDDMPFMSTSSLYTDSNYMHCSINGEDKKKIYYDIQMSNTTCLTVYNFVMIRTSASVFAFPVKVLTGSDIFSSSGRVIRTYRISFHD